MGSDPNKEITRSKIQTVNFTTATLQPTLDLGDVFYINGATQLTANGTISSFIGQYQYSVDGANWTLLQSPTQANISNTLTPSVSVVQTTFTGIVARYLRLSPTTVTLGTATSITSTLIVSRSFL